MYKSLEQRMVSAYLAMFPPFTPTASGEISASSQKQFYDFMKSVYQKLFDAPESLFLKISEDDAYPNRFNKASYGKPLLYNLMKKDMQEMDNLLESLFLPGAGCPGR